MKRVLAVDDDPNIVELIRLYFEKEGYEVHTCGNGLDAMPAFRDIMPDVVILDLMLPGKDGYDICRELRKESDVPILMLTARGDILDKVVGLELGADDYLQKPFEMKELIARVKAVLRRVDASGISRQEPAEDRQVVSYTGLTIDKDQYTVVINDVSVEMPPKELELFYFLAAHPNRVFTREQLLGSVWGYDFYGESRTVDVHVKRIREKVEERGGSEAWQIKTVWGVGYKFDVN